MMASRTGSYGLFRGKPLEPFRIVLAVADEPEDADR
jgi:hypothetical protein